MSIAAISATLFVSGCGGGNGTPVASTQLPSSVQDAIDSPKSNLTQELKNTLSYMGNEERLAYDVYNKLYEKWGTKQFTNIATKSEYKHITAVQELVQKYNLNDSDFSNVDLNPLGYKNSSIESMKAGTYDISKIQNLYDSLVAQGAESEIEALKVGCTVEVVDVNDLDKYITLAENSNADDVVEVFKFLRNGSYNHYWAFDKGLKNRGVSDGCCSWDELCHPEYPQNKKGNR